MQLLYFCNHVYPQCCRCYKITRNFRCSSITLCPLGRQQQREQDWLYSSQETSSFKNFLALGGLSRAGAAKPVNFDRLNTYRILRNVTRFTWFQVLPSCTSLQIMLVSNIFFFLGSMSFTERALQLFFLELMVKKELFFSKGICKERWGAREEGFLLQSRSGINLLLLLQ